MKPAICAVCHRYSFQAQQPESGRWIAFINSIYDREEAGCILGHPEELE